MIALLDTHVLLWWLVDDPRISANARSVIQEPGNELLWSAVSSWEVAVKVSLGRLTLRQPLGAYFDAVFREQGITPLAIEHSHAFRVTLLPHHHRDPFDRMLVAQAQVEGVPILSGDARLRDYDIEVVW